MFLIDTDTLVFFLRGDAQVMARMAEHASDPKAISIITYGELLYGAERSARPIANLARVRQLASLMPVIPIDTPVIETFSALKVRLERDGKRLDDFDVLIAATAIVLNYTLVTNNVNHFARIADLNVTTWRPSTR